MSPPPKTLPPATDSRLGAFFKSIGGIPRAYFKQYGALKITSIILVAYIALFSYAPVGALGSAGGFVDPDVGFIIDPNSPERTEAGVILTRGVERAIVASNNFQMVCLGITRASAFFMYPGTHLYTASQPSVVFVALSRLTLFVLRFIALVFVFLTKFRATMEFISRTPLSLFFYQDLHELHVYCGWVVLIDGLLHALFHILRWANQGNLYLMIEHFSGVSGIISVVCILLVCIPMMAFKKRIKYETRKYLHYFFIVLALALCFHTTTTSIPNGGFSKWIFSILIGWYFLDSLYVYIFMTEKIESTSFHVVPTGVQLTMTVSKRFEKGVNNGGYCYVCFPWIDKWQWHAFSLFENPANPAERQIYLQNVGDWTNAVCEALQRNTVRPVWVQGPFSSPYDKAADFDNQILVAGGIGITPAISVMRAHKETRRTNLIWAARDPHMVEFFLKHGEFSSRGWNLVFYTGKEPLYIGDSTDITTSSGALVHIIRARPDFAKLIPNIIYSIESGTFAPESFVSDSKLDVIADLNEKLEELDEDAEMTSQEKLDELINYADELGYLFTDIVATAVAASSVDDKGKSDGLQILAEEGQVKNGAVEEGQVENGHSNSDRSVGPSGDILSTIRRASVMHNTSPRRASVIHRTSIGASMKPPHRGLSKRPNASGNYQSTRMRTGVSRRASMTWNAVNTAVSQTHGENALQNSFKPWEAESTDTKAYVESLDDKQVLATWGVLYCGGKTPLADSVAEVSKQYGINIALESFEW